MNALVGANTMYLSSKHIERYTIQRESGLKMTLQLFNQENYQQQTFTLEDFHAKVSALLESEEVSKIHEELFSLNSCGWLEKESLNIYSLRTSKDYFPTMEEKLSEQSSIPYGNVGIMQNGRHLTLKISEYHKTEKECSLSDILEDNPDQKYFLSEEKVQAILSNLARDAE